MSDTPSNTGKRAARRARAAAKSAKKQENKQDKEKPDHRPPPLRSPSQLTGASPTVYEAEQTLNSLATGESRAVAILGGAYVERALRTAITKHLRPIDELESYNTFEDGGNGPLSSFSAKIALGFVLGIYGEQTKGDLETVKKIRNIFAHSMLTLTFSTPEIWNLCGQLKFDGEFHRKGEMSIVETMNDIREAGYHRRKYMRTVLMLYRRLIDYKVHHRFEPSGLPPPGVNLEDYESLP